MYGLLDGFSCGCYILIWFVCLGDSMLTDLCGVGLFWGMLLRLIMLFCSDSLDELLCVGGFS